MPGNAIFSRSVGRFFPRARAVTRLSRLAVRPQGQGEQALERDWLGACRQVSIQRAYCRFAKPHLVAARWKRRCSVAHRKPLQSRRPTPQSRPQSSTEPAPSPFCLCAFVGRVAWHSTGMAPFAVEEQRAGVAVVPLLRDFGSSCVKQHHARRRSCPPDQETGSSCEAVSLRFVKRAFPNPVPMVRIPHRRKSFMKGISERP